MNVPRVSFVMPVYNAAPYLREALDGVLAQTLRDWELVAVDDASTDGSLEILHACAEGDGRIRVIRQTENKGMGETMDRAVAAARASIIARVDADDVCEPGRLTVQLDYLDAHPDVVAVGGQIREMREDGSTICVKPFPTDPVQIHAMMFYCVPIQHPALTVNRALLPDDFDWYEGLRFGEDIHLFFKLTQFGKLSNVPEVVLNYRCFAESTLRRNPRAIFLATYQARLRAVREYGYRPTVKARLVNRMQWVVVRLIPQWAILPVYNLVRGLMLRFGVGKS